MKQNSLLFIIGLFFFLSCKENSKKTDSIFSHEVEMDIFNIKDRCRLSEFIESVDYMKLTLPSDYFFGEINNILFHNEDIYIIDQKQKMIFRFNNEGEFLNLIGKNGNGPEEFLQLYRVVSFGENVAVCDISSRKINIYTPDGIFIEKKDIPYVYRYIASLANEKFLCFIPEYNEDGYNFGLWSMNQTGEIDNIIYQPSYLYPSYASSWNVFFCTEENKIGIANPSLFEFYFLDIEKNDLSYWLKIKPNSKILGDFKGVSNPGDIKESFTYCSMYSFSENYGFIFFVLPESEFFTYSVYNIKNNTMTLYENVSTDIRGCNSLGAPISSNLTSSLVSVIWDGFPQHCFPENFSGEKLDESSVILQIFKMK